VTGHAPGSGPIKEVVEWRVRVPPLIDVDLGFEVFDTLSLPNWLCGKG
jgi:hypothetical protein